jgi:hypothetical protein
VILKHAAPKLRFPLMLDICSVHPLFEPLRGMGIDFFSRESFVQHVGHVLPTSALMTFRSTSRSIGMASGQR